MVTCYDARMAALLEKTRTDILLVGDSVGMVMLGFSSTRAVTLSHMKHHTEASRRGSSSSVIVADLPYESVSGSVAKAVRGAKELLRAGANAVKIEWSERAFDQSQAILRAGIPVMGHLGLTPQAVRSREGYRLQAKDAYAAWTLLKRACQWETMGVFSLVLECVPSEAGKAAAERLSIPVIGIGAGPFCDGQVLVYHDIVGAFDEFKPRFVKRYANLRGEEEKALIRFGSEVRRGAYPAKKETYSMKPDERTQFLRMLKDERR